MDNQSFVLLLFSFYTAIFWNGIILFPYNSPNNLMEPIYNNAPLLASLFGSFFFSSVYLM